MTEKPNAPELIEDQALDAANGGLLPAVKKISAPTAPSAPSGVTKTGPGTVVFASPNTVAGDGSV